MPNWVNNYVTVNGEPESIRLFMERIGSEDRDPKSEEFRAIDFNRLKPLPRELLTGGGWYEWSVENWGTKWNSCDSELVDDNILRFNTAWDRPEPVFDMLLDLADEIGGITSIEITWEEEQGFGEEYIMVRESEGHWDKTEEVSWDMPDWEEVEECNGFAIVEQKKEHPKVAPGFYVDWSEAERFDTLEEAREYCQS